MKSITSKLSIIILSLFVSAPSLGWADIFDSISNDVKHDEKSVNHDIKKQEKSDEKKIPKADKPIVNALVKANNQANKETIQIVKGACTSGLDEIIKKAIGRSCTAFNVEFSASCNAALDGETVGAGMAICVTATGIIKSQCKGVVKEELGTAVTQAAC